MGQGHIRYTLIVPIALAAILGAGCQSEYEKQYDQAKQLSEEGRYLEAIAAYEKAAEIDPERARPLFRAAKLFKHMAEHTSSVVYLERALEREPDYLDIYPELVKELGRAGQFDRAQQEARKALDMDIVQRDLAIREEIQQQLEEVLRAREAASTQPPPLPEPEAEPEPEPGPAIEPEPETTPTMDQDLPTTPAELMVAPGSP